MIHPSVKSLELTKKDLYLEFRLENASHTKTSIVHGLFNEQFSDFLQRLLNHSSASQITDITIHSPRWVFHKKNATVDQLQNTVDFFKRFTQQIKEIDPERTISALVTDEGKFTRIYWNVMNISRPAVSQKSTQTPTQTEKNVLPGWTFTSTGLYHETPQEIINCLTKIVEIDPLSKVQRFSTISGKCERITNPDVYKENQALKNLHLRQCKLAEETEKDFSKALKIKNTLAIPQPEQNIGRPSLPAREKTPLAFSDYPKKAFPLTVGEKVPPDAASALTRHALKGIQRLKK